ncbi:MAG TPA: SMC family ATPase [Candidatus Blautia stercoravium]|nr:SMC family ATPase [Candidatus Blautia stercoravium]
MRPLRMKLQGLNSFLEPQEIDFELLTSRGLFGIFGPTGSGKSSILDGMTLALYGTTARNSANFIHVSTDKAFVEYTFSVKEKKERIYQVSRSFKRSKEGTIRSDSARFAELTEGKHEILADRVGTVNEKCRDVLGLSKEDFFRTVVLPQGKFSEFLKLEGMERNKMLERLFHLEKYGEQLASLVKDRALQWNGKMQENEGALSRYEEVRPEDVQDLQEKAEQIRILSEEKSTALKAARVQLEQGQKFAALEQEWLELTSQASKLKAQKEKIDLLQEEEKQAQTANYLWTYLQEARNTKAAWTSSQAKQELLKTALTQKQEESQKLRNAKEKSQLQVQKELPLFKLEQAKLQEAVVLLSSRQKAEKQWTEAKNAAQKTDRSLEDSCLKMEKLLQDIEHRKSQKEALSLEIEAVTMTAKQQQETEEGYRLVMEQNALLERKKGITAQLTELAEKERKAEAEKIQTRQQLAKKEADLQKQTEEAERILERQKALPEAEVQKEHLLLVKAEQEKAAVLQQNIKEQEILCADFRQKIKEKTAEKEKAVEKRDMLEKQYLDNLAAILASELKEGQPCPVCGSIHHEKTVSQAERGSLTQFAQKRQQAEQNLQKLSAELSRLELQLENSQSMGQTAWENLQNLNAALLNENLQELETKLETQRAKRTALEQALAQSQEQRSLLEKEILTLQTQNARAETEQVHQYTRQKEVQDELQALTQSEVQQQKQILELKKRAQTEDFIQAYKELQNKNRLREEKQKQLSLLETAIHARIQNKEKGDLLIQKTREEKTRLEMQVSQYEQKLKELTEQITDKSGSCKDPQKRCHELETIMEEIQQSYTRITAQAEKAQKEEEHLCRKYAANEALTQALLTDFRQKQKLLLEKMEEYQIAEESWIETHQREETELLAMREKAENYRESCFRVQLRLETVKQQKAVLSQPKEPLSVLETAVSVLEKESSDTVRELGGLKQQLQQLKLALKEKEKLEGKKKEIAHTLDILSELEGLFRGKRFVEYVSRYYLEYVSREADAQLKEMTGSSYGLETDGSGMFIIRDYKNGGVSRPASTLSGGETFMASLALALALSSQIQMKGTAPLEFFFLDEGFGTLDETCLDVVMESLEKIKNRQRSVGIITHVEDIKARIPMHLIVEPARMGEGGSRVHIEEA